MKIWTIILLSTMKEMTYFMRQSSYHSTTRMIVSDYCKHLRWITQHTYAAIHYRISIPRHLNFSIINLDFKSYNPWVVRFIILSKKAYIYFLLNIDLIVWCWFVFYSLMIIMTRWLPILNLSIPTMNTLWIGFKGNYISIQTSWR